MAVTIEDLYRNYGILADAKDDLSKVSYPRLQYVHRYKPLFSLRCIRVP